MSAVASGDPGLTHTASAHRTPHNITSGLYTLIPDQIAVFASPAVTSRQYIVARSRRYLRRRHLVAAICFVGSATSRGDVRLRFFSFAIVFHRSCDGKAVHIQLSGLTMVYRRGMQLVKRCGIMKHNSQTPSDQEDPASSVSIEKVTASQTPKLPQTRRTQQVVSV